jgi:cell division protein FtsB
MKRDRTPLRRLRIRVAYLVIAVVIVLFAVKFVQKAWQAHELALQLAAEQQQTALIAQDNARLEQTIRYDQTNRYIEDAARQLGYTRPGEWPVIVASTTTVPMLRPATLRHSQYSAKPPPPWQQWWNVFFGSHAQGR